MHESWISPNSILCPEGFGATQPWRLSILWSFKKGHYKTSLLAPQEEWTRSRGRVRNHYQNLMYPNYIMLLLATGTEASSNSEAEHENHTISESTIHMHCWDLHSASAQAYLQRKDTLRLEPQARKPRRAPSPHQEQEDQAGQSNTHCSHTATGILEQTVILPQSLDAHGLLQGYLYS